MNYKKILIEQINVSDDEYKLVHVSTTGKVNRDDVICSYESSKSTFDVESDNEGWFYPNPNLNIGESYPVGTLLAIISSSQIDEKTRLALFELPEKESREETFDNIVTKKARILIEKHNIDINVFSEHDIVSEDIVNDYLKKGNLVHFQSIDYYVNNTKLDQFENKPRRIALIGAGKAALQVIDAIYSTNEFIPVIIYEKKKSIENSSILGIPIRYYSDASEIAKDYQEDMFQVCAITFSGDIINRKILFDQLSDLGIVFVNIIHKNANIGMYSKIGVGNLIFANSRIGPFTQVGCNNVISAQCNIEHHNLIGSHNTFGPAVVFSGSCSVGDQNRFGTGIYIEPNVRIGSMSIISSGVILTRNVNDKRIVRNITKYDERDLI